MLRFFKNLFWKSEGKPGEGASWPFDQAKNCAVITTAHVMKQGRFIAYVFHDADDHGWQFHHDAEKNIEDSMVVLLEEIVAQDPSLLEIADLPPGWMAMRTKRGAAWQKKKSAEDASPEPAAVP